MHPRISLHQVAFIQESTTDFVAHCRQLGVAHMTLVSLRLMQPELVAEVRERAEQGGPRTATLNHPFALYPNIEEDRGAAAEGLLKAMDVAAALGTKAIYLQTGGRGGLSWEQAAARFAALLAPARDLAAARGMTLMIENASAFNADIHIAHTLADTITLSEISGAGICIDLQPCWAEAGLAQLFRRAMPMTGLVQVSDYVLGDRSAPCRAVPGDGAIPLERLIGELLEAGYEGLFDLELVGPRIEAEGALAASRRAVERLAAMLTRLGA